MDLTLPLPIHLFVMRLGVAMVLGALIGTERAWHHSMAGPRTNALVSCGSAVFLMLGSLLGGDGAARIAAQIVSGIGFLGGGVILKEGVNIRGLNTSATIWCSAAIGTMAGSGKLIYAALAAACVIVVNLVFRPLAMKLNPMEIYYELDIVARPADVVHCRSLLLNTMSRDVLTLQSMKSRPIEDRVRLTACLKAETQCDRVLEQLVARLLHDESLAGASWRPLPAMSSGDIAPESEPPKAASGAA